METRFMPSMASHQVMPPPDQVNGWHCRSCGTTTSSNLLILPACSHRFCMSCMDLWIWEYVSRYGGRGRRYPCPVCWEMYQIPPDGLEAFQQNIHVLRLEMELEQLNMKTGPTGGGSDEMNVHALHNVDGQVYVNQTNSPNEPVVGGSAECEMMEERSEEQIGNFSSFEENCRPSNNCALVPYCQLPTHMF